MRRLLRQLFCRHRWRHSFYVTASDAQITCQCLRCGKSRRPDHTWPQFGDYIKLAPGLELVDELKEELRGTATN